MFGNFRFSGLKKWVSTFLPALPQRPPAHSPDRQAILHLSTLIAIAVISHFYIAMPVIAIFALLIFSFKYSLILRHRPAPPTYILILLTIVSLLMVVIFYGGWNGQKAGISYLILLLSLKYLESNSLRDYYLVCLILYFLSAASFLFNTSILMIIVIVAYTVAITSMLVKLTQPDPSSTVYATKQAGSVVLKALPLTILLFFFFPRIHSDIGFIPSLDDATSNQLSNTLKSGEFARSAFNNSLAFRVEFDGDAPDYSQLYWRAKVMPNESNFQWSLAEIPTLKQQTENSGISNTNDVETDYQYTIVHEPSSDHYLPYLDYVVEYSKGKQLTDGSVGIKDKERSTFSYQGKSILAPPTTISADEWQQLTMTSFSPDSRTASLLTQWQTNFPEDKQRVQAVFEHFRDNDFRYSLRPPALNQYDIDNAVEQFLFETRTGYCEHYASVYTMLMRWMNIPARVVVGYQGGDLNNSGNFYDVRYSDAHAWSEVWIDGQWVRVDPTSAIAPERIEFGMDMLLALLEDDLYQGNTTGRALSDVINPTGMAAWLQSGKDNLNNLAYQWDRWVINYDFDKQRELLAALGIRHAKTFQVLVIILMVTSGLLLMLYFFRWPSKSKKYNDVQKQYLHFVKQFAKADIVKQPSDSPLDFADKAKIKFPTLAQKIDVITNLYIQIRYSKNSQSNTLNQTFTKIVKQFRINKKHTASPTTD